MIATPHADHHDPTPPAKNAEAPVNIAWTLAEVAQRLPNKPAIVCAAGRGAGGKYRYVSDTFDALERRCRRFARGLGALGIGRGTRTLLFVPPSIDFFPLTFALFRVGAVPVMIDPGLGREGLLRAVAESEPEAMIGVPKAHLARLLFPRAFKSVRTHVTVGRRLGWGGATLADLERHSDAPLELEPTSARDIAAILFTSGSTGAAKGAVYTHGIFDAQVRIIRREWGIGEDEIDLPAFPLFALFSAGLGVTCVVPDMDASRPGAVDPRKIVEQIRDHRPTYSFGSPAFWTRVASHCRRERLTLESLRRVFIAGAPVSPRLVTEVRAVLGSDADVFIPYGATESLPVSWISGREVVEDTRVRTDRGEGICVGRPIAESEVRVIAIKDEPLNALSDAERLGPGQIGEIIVRGAVTTEQYFRRPEDDARAKIHDPETGAIWHRMGDLGWLEPSGRLWFCGRKAHRVVTQSGTLYTIPCEAIFNQHPSVRRSALVGLGPRGDQRPVIVIECHREARPRGRAAEAALRRELLDLGQRSVLTAGIRNLLFHPSFPVDVRHNAKIKRELLAEWAETQRVS